MSGDRARTLRFVTVLIPAHPRSQPRVKSAGALTERVREFERFGREGDANVGCSCRSPIGPTQTESAAASPDPHLTPETPSFPPPRAAARNRPGRKAKPARFRGPVRSSPRATLFGSLGKSERVQWGPECPLAASGRLPSEADHLRGRPRRVLHCERRRSRDSPWRVGLWQPLSSVPGRSQSRWPHQRCRPRASSRRVGKLVRVLVLPQRQSELLCAGGRFGRQSRGWARHSRLQLGGGIQCVAGFPDRR